MSWNYRVVRRVYGGEETFGIYEAYYGDAENPPFVGDNERFHIPAKVRSITTTPVDVIGDSVAELRTTLDWMRKALDEPVIEYDDIASPRS